MDSAYPSTLIEQSKQNQFCLFPLSVKVLTSFLPSCCCFSFFSGIFEYIITNKTVLAYRHFFSIVHTPPLDPRYNEFKQTVDRYLELPPFNLTNHLKEETTNISRMVIVDIIIDIKFNNESSSSSSLSFTFSLSLPVSFSLRFPPVLPFSSLHFSHTQSLIVFLLQADLSVQLH